MEVKNVIVKTTRRVIVLTKNDLLEWLKERGAAEAFALNLLLDEDPLHAFRNGPCNWISTAFIWEHTSQGQSFWSVLSHEWEKYVLGLVSRYDAEEAVSAYSVEAKQM